MSRTRIVLVGLLGFILALLVMVAGPDSTVEAFNDGRVNCHSASPVAIYCTDDGILVLGIIGQELLKVSAQVLADAEVPAAGEDPVELGASVSEAVLGT
ncbi:hypothetical protein ACFLYO_08815, partial [Chloroflexota bacterium]